MTWQIPTRRQLAVLVSVSIALALLFFVAATASEYMASKFLAAEAVLIQLDALRALVGDVDTGERGFLLTSDQQYLAPLRQAATSLPKIEAAIDESMRNQERELQTQATRYIALVESRTTHAKRILAIEHTAGVNAAREAEQPESAERLMNAIRDSLSELHLRINRDQSSYARAQTRFNTLAFFLFAIGTSLMLVTLIRLYQSAVASLKARDELYNQVQALNANLEAEVDLRTRDLKAANEELSQFAYVASHDLQEPLRTVTTFSQLLETRYKNHLDEDADEFIHYIVSSSRRMIDLINGLLALLRLRRDSQPAASVSFEDMLMEAQTGLHIALHEARAQVLVEGKLPSLVVDRAQFMQVIDNLLSNAVKYRSEHPLLIRVSAKQIGKEWIFSVADNGRGFDQQYAQRIFGIFQRLHGNEVPEGTGMGLPISRKIVENHGGRMWAESAAGIGSKFFFSLPLSLEIARETERSEKTALANSA